MAKSVQVIGRVAEKRVLDTVLASRDPELVAVYGRRRVGKTFLIREHMKPRLVFRQLHVCDRFTNEFSISPGGCFPIDSLAMAKRK